jgi:arylformamidase
VFIHGGAWRAGSAASAAYQSEMFVDAGAHFIALDFNNVIETKGDLMVMVDQVRRGVAWVYRNAASFGGDHNRIYLSGHSSGGHLAAVAVTTDWRKAFGFPIDIVKGALLASGMYDLYPVSLSVRSSYVNFTAQVIEALSPKRHLDALVAPVIVFNPLELTARSNARPFCRVVRTSSLSSGDRGEPMHVFMSSGTGRQRSSDWKQCD